MGWLAPHQRIGVVVCSPHRKFQLPDGNWIADTVTVDWHRARTALSFGTNIVTIEMFADGMEVGEARDGVARRCLAHNPRPEYLLFIDDDVLPSHDAFVKLFARAQWTPDHDIFAGVYCTKGGAFPEPLIYAGDGCGPFWDWAVGDLLTTEGHGITSVHMGLTLIRVSLFQRMIDAGLVDAEADGPEPFFKTVKETDGRGRTRQGTEDIYFCQKALKAGAKILVDTSCLAGHIDKTSGAIWGLHPDCPPVKRAKWLGRKDSNGEAKKNCPACKGSGKVPTEFITVESASLESKTIGKGTSPCALCSGTGEDNGSPPLKIALDLGAGGRRREWPGHKTYTLDIRPEAKPDYCQDTRLLNFPNDHWDLIASSHHLEHIGRWDQEAVWSEMFRVTKPGGSFEHIVPSLDWAARKVSEGEVDEHVFNVLYGAQEAHGYERTLNLHYFGYTKRVAAALAEGAGFVDVICEDWTDNPENGYNLIIKGKKPLAVPEAETQTESPACANGKTAAAELVPV